MQAACSSVKPTRHTAAARFYITVLYAAAHRSWYLFSLVGSQPVSKVPQGVPEASGLRLFRHGGILGVLLSRRCPLLLSVRDNKQKRWEEINGPGLILAGHRLQNVTQELLLFLLHASFPGSSSASSSLSLLLMKQSWRFICVCRLEQKIDPILLQK